MPELWYAVRTRPNAQQPQREYAVETTRSRKGYRIVSSLNANVSFVERSLMDAGFDCWMPQERRLQRDRRRPYMWKARRFPLLVGYCLVRCDDSRIGELESVPGVYRVVKNAEGQALPIPITDLMIIRRAEAKEEVQFDKHSREARQRLRRLVKEQPELQKIVDRFDIAGELTVPLHGDPLAA